MRRVKFSQLAAASSAGRGALGVVQPPPSGSGFSSGGGGEALEPCHDNHKSPQHQQRHVNRHDQELQEHQQQQQRHSAAVPSAVRPTSHMSGPEEKAVELT
jgi:hypothetical protein